MKIHELKCWPASFQALSLGIKRAEIRIDDRGYQEGDVLHLREYAPHLGIIYTGEECLAQITHILRLDEPPLNIYSPTAGKDDEAWVMLSLNVLG